MRIRKSGWMVLVSRGPAWTNHFGYHGFLKQWYFNNHFVIYLFRTTLTAIKRNEHIHINQPPLTVERLLSWMILFTGMSMDQPLWMLINWTIPRYFQGFQVWGYQSCSPKHLKLLSGTSISFRGTFVVTWFCFESSSEMCLGKLHDDCVMSKAGMWYRWDTIGILLGYRTSITLEIIIASTIHDLPSLPYGRISYNEVKPELAENVFFCFGNSQIWKVCSVKFQTSIRHRRYIRDNTGKKTFGTTQASQARNGRGHGDAAMQGAGCRVGMPHWR